MSPLLALAVMAQATAGMSGQAAVDRVKSLLKGFDVPGPIRLEGLGTIEGPAASLWHVTVKDSKKQSYEAYLETHGKSTYLFRGQERDNFGGMTSKPLDDPAYQALVARWLRATKTQEPTRLEPLTGDEKGRGKATFRLLRNGHPFVSYKRFEYVFTFSTPGREFLSYRATEQPPPVSGASPKLDKAGALAALQRIWDTEVAPAAKQRGWKRVWYTLTGSPELGYYQPDNSATAVLVWRIPYWSHRDVGHAIQGGGDAMLIDAATGRRVVTNVVP